MEVSLGVALSIWYQLGSLCFVLSGLFSDLLVIRCILWMANFFMFLNSILGSPIWPSLYVTDSVSINGLVWAVMNLYIFTTGIVRLLLDETHTPPKAELDPLWRFLFRMGGVSRRQFQKYIAPKVAFRRYNKGDLLPTDKYFFIVYKGVVQIEVHDLRKTTKDQANNNNNNNNNNNKSTSRVVQSFLDGSGTIFDYKALGLVNMTTYKETVQKQNLVATAESEVFVFQFSQSNIRSISLNPTFTQCFSTIFIGALARTMTILHDTSRAQKYMDPSHVAHLFLPLEPKEQPANFLAGNGQALNHIVAHMWHYMKVTFSLPWPIGHEPYGLRHNLKAPQSNLLFEEHIDTDVEVGVRVFGSSYFLTSETNNK